MNRAWDRFEPTMRWPNPTTVLRSPRRPQAQHVLRWLRQRWVALLAGAAALALLLAFHQVVTGAVLQAESRRNASAAHADARWRCQALDGVHQREACLAQSNPPASSL